MQYIPQRRLPDKAIDLLDMTAAHLAAQHPVADKVALEKRQQALTHEKDEAAKTEDFERAAKLKAELAKVEDDLAHADDTPEAKPVVATPDDVAQAVERLTGIPVAKLGANDIERLRDIGKRLKGKVIGQDEAVDMVARAIRRNRAGFDEATAQLAASYSSGQPASARRSWLSSWRWIYLAARTRLFAWICPNTPTAPRCLS